MSTLVTRSGKGSPLTHNEVDTNFTNLNTDKVEKTAADITGGTINNTTVGATTPSTGVFTTLTAQNETLKGTGNNLTIQSQTFANAAWSKSNTSITSSTATAPDSTSTACTLTEDTATNQHNIAQPARTIVSGTIITLSVYVKANGRNFCALYEGSVGQGKYFNITAGGGGSVLGNLIAAPTSAALTYVGNDWYRISIVVTSTSSVTFTILISTDGTSFSYTGNGTSGINIWGAQTELGSVLNTYIPTTTTAVYGTPTLSFSGVASIGLQSDGSLYETSAGTGNVRFYTNNIGQEQMRVSHTASAVNYLQVTGNVTGSRPTISSQGSDSNIGMNFLTKGNRAFSFLTNNVTAFEILSSATSVNYFQVNGGATGFGPVLQALGSDTNIPAVVQPKGTGALQAQQTDSTATGGNARGANAVDWQTARGTAGQVASGQLSFIGGGTNNTASQYNATVVGGFGNTVSNVASFVGSGSTNTASGQYGGIVTGIANTTAGYLNFIGGGFTNSGTSGSAVTTQSATMNATTAVTLSGSNANIKVGQYIVGTSIGADTYVAAISGTSLTLSKVASGSSTSTLSFYTPHGVVVGGGNNQATGSYSFIGGGGDAGTAANRNVASGDWSFVGGGRSNTASAQGAVVCGGGIYAGVTFANTASGQTSFLGGGLSNTASGQGSVVSGGYANTVSGTYSSIVGGSYGTTRGLEGYTTFPAGNALLGTIGGAQASLLILAVQTTDATATVLRSSGAAASTTNQVILPNNSAYYFKGSVIANVTGGGNTKAWAIEGAIKRGANAASTALVGTPTVTSGYADAGASTWAITATADTTNGGLAITFTGQAGTTIRVVCKVETTEVTF